MADQEYYGILGVGEGATDIEIKKAYRQEALKWHPDKNPDNKEESEKRFKALAEAYKILSSPEKRAIYDHGGKDAVRQSGGYSRTDFGDIASALRKFEEAVKESRVWLMEELYGERPRRMQVGRSSLMRKEVGLPMSSRNREVEMLKRAEALEQAVHFIEGKDEDRARDKKQKKRTNHGVGATAQDVKPQRSGPKGAHLGEVEPRSKESKSSISAPNEDLATTSLQQLEGLSKSQKKKGKKKKKAAEAAAPVAAEEARQWLISSDERIPTPDASQIVVADMPKLRAPVVPFQMLPSVNTWMVPCKPWAAQDFQNALREQNASVSRGFAMEEAHGEVSEDLGVITLIRSQRKEKPELRNPGEETWWQWLKAVLPCCCGQRPR
eukprot:Skav223809  [mRNA]  locus=scaffold575:712007:713149:- [translate_table: standard]